MLIRGKFLIDRGTAIIEDGTVYLFDLGGRFTGIDDCMHKHLSGLQNFSYISVLSSKGGVDIAVIKDDKMRRFSCSDDANKVAMTLHLSGGFLRVLTKNEKTQNQLIFLYNSDVNLLSKLGNLKIKEVFQ